MTTNSLPPIAARLKADIPNLHLTIEASELQEYGRDWTKAIPPDPIAVVFPESTEQVSKILKICSELNQKVVPSGGRTGLSGGAVAGQKELVLNLSRMNKIWDLDLGAHTVRAQAGAVTEAVHQYCEKQDLTWPVDFASKGSSQVGGNLSTNAGGVKVIRYGLTRNWVLGLTVVLAKGEILELNGALEKNQTGLDLRQLFIGSEGTLGVITEALLKLTPVSHGAQVFFFACQDLGQVLKLFARTRVQKFALNAFEVLDRPCLKTVLSHRGLKAPFEQSTIESCESFVLVEVEAASGEQGQSALEQFLGELFEENLVQDGVLAQSPQEARDIWSMREGVAESVMAKGMVHKHDVSVPISSLVEFTSQFCALLEKKYQGFEVYNFGHIGDGNLHINIRKPDALGRDEFIAKCKQMDQELFELVASFKGSVSAEHGIGLLKKYALKYSRTPAEIGLMRSVKLALDPRGILNPGKIFD
jgi:glycolate oxidase subunit GlcD